MYTLSLDDLDYMLSSGKAGQERNADLVHEHSAPALDVAFQRSPNDLLDGST
jgi:hypothetical protein